MLAIRALLRTAAKLGAALHHPQELIELGAGDAELVGNDEQHVLFVIADELGISRAQFDQFLRMMQGGAQFGGGSQQRSYGQHGGNGGRPFATSLSG